MSTEILGNNFDIHGGGQDLTFPHHENEIAQSCCAYPGSHFANIWMHNGFINMNNEKMSKSLGNFYFLRDVLKEFPGEAVRYVLLSAQYRQPQEFNFDLLKDAKTTLDRWYRALEKAPNQAATKPTEAFLSSLSDDLNTPGAYAELHRLVSEIYKTEDAALVGQLKACANILGLLQSEPQLWFKGTEDSSAIDALIAARITARKSKDFAEADRLRKELTDMGIVIDDRPDGTTEWRRA
jgi:cysteinyl-tRNA synthetase